MSKLGKKLSDKLDDAATRVILAGERIGGERGAKAANLACGALLGRYWKECGHGGCDCHEFGIAGKQ